jgi:hypothetical protein
MYLNDRAILETQTLKTLIPFAVVKNNPHAYYPKMLAHAKFLHGHRSITLKSITESDYETVDSNANINTTIQKAPLKNALRSNRMIHRIHENFEHNSVTVSVNADTYTDVLKWIDTILPKFNYHPQRAQSSATSDGTTTETSRPTKYSKVFTQSTDTESTANSSFDPSTIASVRTARTNAWSNGPPLNVTFDRRARTRSVSVNPTPQTHTYEAYHQQAEADDDASNTTPISRPSSMTMEIPDLVQQAMDKERAELDKRIAALESQQQALMKKLTCGIKRYWTCANKSSTRPSKDNVGLSRSFLPICYQRRCPNVARTDRSRYASTKRGSHYYEQQHVTLSAKYHCAYSTHGSPVCG